MAEIADEDLISAAEDALNPHVVSGPIRQRHIGDVASALITDAGDIFRGVCIDTGAGTGFCAEHAAIAAMVTAGQYRIARIVAVWRDENGSTLVVPPCGRCREFIRQVDASNVATDVIVGPTESVKLSELLPHGEWPRPVD